MDTHMWMCVIAVQWGAQACNGKQLHTYYLWLPAGKAS